MTPWYESWFDSDEYELVYQHRDDREAAKLVATIIEITGGRNLRLLDVGCGRGRHAIPFAREGFDVTGVDLSKRSIEAARVRAIEGGVDVNFVVADMRESLFVNRFDVVVNLFTAFGFFEQQSDHQRAIDSMSHALRPGGILIQDFLNAHYVRDNFVALTRTETDSVKMIQERSLSSDRVEKQITISHDGEDYSFRESVRLYEQHDFEAMYSEAGLTIVRTMGDYDGSAWTKRSPRLIMISEKADAK